MRPDNREVADKLREMADLLDLGLAYVRSASVTDSRSMFMGFDGKNYLPRTRQDYLQMEATVEGATEEQSQMGATVSWSFAPKAKA